MCVWALLGVTWSVRGLRGECGRETAAPAPYQLLADTPHVPVIGENDPLSGQFGDAQHSEAEVVDGRLERGVEAVQMHLWRGRGVRG